MANSLLLEIASAHPTDRIVILEDTAEIRCTSADHIALRTADGYDLAQLVKWTLRLHRTGSWWGKYAMARRSTPWTPGRLGIAVASRPCMRPTRLAHCIASTGLPSGRMCRRNLRSSRRPSIGSSPWRTGRSWALARPRPGCGGPLHRGTLRHPGDLVMRFLTSVFAGRRPSSSCRASRRRGHRALSAPNDNRAAAARESGMGRYGWRRSAVGSAAPTVARQPERHDRPGARGSHACDRGGHGASPDTRKERSGSVKPFLASPLCLGPCRSLPLSPSLAPSYDKNERC